MKLDRLMGILAVMQQQGRVTAAGLAEKFEVSAKTIQRDMDALCRAGFPIAALRGAGGGYAIMEGYQLNPMALTRAEMEALWAGVGSLRSVAQQDAENMARRLPGDYRDVSIDLASFYRDSLAEKIRLLRDAIRERYRVTFQYASPKGESRRKVEPCQVVYRWSDWYVYGFDCEKQEFRTFKLRRLWQLERTGETFAAHPAVEKQYGDFMRDEYMVSARYAPECKYRLVEERGPDSFYQQPDGRLMACWGFDGPRQAASWFLGFGAQAEVIEPEEVRQILRAEAAKMQKIYEK